MLLLHRLYTLFRPYETLDWPVILQRPTRHFASLLRSWSVSLAYLSCMKCPCHTISLVGTSTFPGLLGTGSQKRRFKESFSFWLETQLAGTSSESPTISMSQGCRVHRKGALVSMVSVLTGKQGGVWFGLEVATSRDLLHPSKANALAFFIRVSTLSPCGSLQSHYSREESTFERTPRRS